MSYLAVFKTIERFHRDILRSEVSDETKLMVLLGSIVFTQLEVTQRFKKNHRKIHVLDRKFIEYCTMINKYPSEKNLSYFQHKKLVAYRLKIKDNGYDY